MIDFVCRCGYQLSVPQELAGSSIQCPQCHNLSDVPLLSDLQNMEQDGTFKVDDLRLKSEPERIMELRRIYLPGRQDDDGVDIDLRASFEDLQKAGVQEIPLDAPDGLIPAPPKYDPVTGELLEPLEIKRDTSPRRAIPVPPSSLNYFPADHPDTAALGSLTRVLINPGSLAVMGGVMAAHLFLMALFIPVGVGMLYAFLLILPLMAVIFAHYAVVIEEVGPGGTDELPVPLHNVSFGDDVFRPSINIIGSLLLSYAPAILASCMGHVMFLWAMVAFGTLLFPAVLLTTCASGMLVDLRPDRIYGVIMCCRLRYLVALGLWLLTLLTYVAGYTAVTLVALDAGALKRFMPLNAGIVLGSIVLLAIGVVCAHIFSTYLGLLYRRHRSDFPWVFRLQRLADERAARRRTRFRRVVDSRDVRSSSQAHAASTAQPVPAQPPMPVKPQPAIPLEPARRS